MQPFSFLSIEKQQQKSIKISFKKIIRKGKDKIVERYERNENNVSLQTN